MNFRFSKDLSVDSSLRKELARPFGKIMTTKQVAKRLSINERIYAIGDVTLDALLRNGYTPKIGIFDYRSERGRAYFPIIKREYARPLLVKNRRGVLSRKLWDAVRKASRSKKPVGIRVFGEEDLASLACIYFARSGEYVIYGLRGRGMAVIKINVKIKDYVVRVLRRMSLV